MDFCDKVIIVEGKSDKKRLEHLIAEPIDIICTNGTLSNKRLEEIIKRVAEQDVYIFVDEDSSGKKLRAQLKREFPNANHLYTRKSYTEIARTPYDYLAKVLRDAYIKIDEFPEMPLGIAK
jgi:toprim domain protein